MADISNYFPPVVAQTKQFEEIAKAENPEFNQAKGALSNLFFDEFVLDATTNGVQRWEALLNIKPKSMDSLLARKYQILARIGEFPPFTYRYLTQYMDSICGVGKYSIELKHLEYKLITRIYLEETNFQNKLLVTVKEAFRRIVPANIITDTGYQYNAGKATVLVAAVQKIGVWIEILPCIKRQYQSKSNLSIAAITYVNTYIEIQERKGKI